jgi:phosphatidate cytidylyltransferase
MFWKRALTAVLLAPPILLAIWFFPPSGIVGLVGLATLLATMELARLIPFSGPGPHWIYVLVLVGLGGLGSVAVVQNPASIIWIVLAIAFAWWLYMAGHLLWRREPLGGLYASTPGKAFAGILVLAPAWISIVYLHGLDYPKHPLHLVYLLFLIWIADSAAYLAGKSVGRHKLAPVVSPGKTVEGAAGALAIGALFAAGSGAMLWEYRGTALLVWTGLGVVTVAFSIVGDLTESVFKRVAGKKDSGQLLPGHGGMFDRIDALTAAAPIFGLGCMLMQKVVL